VRIGYPCINTTLVCRNRTFRLKSYSEERLVETVASNLECLRQTLGFNARRGLLFFRINSGFVPFASHPVCRFDWRSRFRDEFSTLGRFIKKHGIRVTMHPDQFTLLNSLDEGIFQRSVKELSYHCGLLDLLGVDSSAKVQIHVGGVYSDRRSSLERFVLRWELLEAALRERLVIENDDRNYTLRDCLELSRRTGAPVVFDAFHHEINCSGEPASRAIELAAGTWRKKDGLPIIDYSTQAPDGRRGAHSSGLDKKAFLKFLQESQPFDFDLMLEIKDKEKSAIRAVAMAAKDPRLVRQVARP
jgi:UV DNA damage endonuclease